MNAANKLALYGGEPVRRTPLPYGRQWIDDTDIGAVEEVLRSDFITTGPLVERYEQVFSAAVGAGHAVAVNSGTAALHTAVAALGIGAGDQVVTTPMTFAASANCILYCGAEPVFADVDAQTLNISPERVEEALTSRTKAVIAVDFTGQPCDYRALREIADRRGIPVIEDAAHALGAVYGGQKIGTLNEITCFSTHPVKHITTAEGGMAVTDNPGLASKMRAFRNHGITVDFSEREKTGGWLYEIEELGYNYRLPDVLCALGLSQLGKLDGWLARRRQIARRYTEAFGEMEGLAPLTVHEPEEAAWHIYLILLDLHSLSADRSEIFRALRAEGIGVNVHYIPVHFHPAYRKLGYRRGLCPVAESAYERIITLPLFPKMNDDDVEDVVRAVKKVTEYYITR